MPRDKVDVTNRKVAFLIIPCVCFSLIWLAGWSYTMRVDTPADSDTPREADDRIREVKAALQERLDVDHYFSASSSNTYDAADTGKHRFVTFREPNSIASVDADEGALFTKDADGIAELHFRDESENEKQLTSAGKLNIAATDIADDLINETKILIQVNEYLKSANLAGDGEVALIASDGASAVLASGAKLPLGATMTQDLHITNKAYVDAQKPDVYDSGWFAGAQNTTYTKAHGLSAAPDVIQCFYSDTADGSGDVVQVGAAGYLPGTMAIIVDVDATSVVVRVGNTLASYYDAAGVGKNPTSGFLKVVAVDFN